MSPFITDLAYILMVAGIVTILFKKLKQPLVLGYIVAGFLAGPHMSYTPSVTSMEGIDEWSEIGVIFLMFTLGLEFSFKRIVKMGIRPIITALMVMGCMIGVGGAVATLFGWSSMDKLFLGGMLSMSSTTIIYKAFDDLGLRTKRFASGVMSVLILEDILGILLMVMLSALAVSRQFEGMQLLTSLGKLGFFLLLWFMVGVYMVPLMLRKARRYINSEMLLVVSVGLCFLMAVVASQVGYSPAFGAFMMGSILAETLEAEQIEKTVGSLRDLFGAVFFVSVGMMVEPGVLFEYWLPILVLTMAVVLGQMFFGSLSFFVGGSGLKGAIRSGFSMVQIGEFAFILAALGNDLGVTSEFLYPVVVAVSIITTFLTPYFMRMAPHVCNRIEHSLPAEVQANISKHRAVQARKEEKRRLTVPLAMRRLLQAIFYQTVAFLTICIAITLFFFATVLPLCHHFIGSFYGTMLCVLVTICCLMPCIRPIVIRKNRSREARFLRARSSFCNILVDGVMLLKLLMGFFVIYYVIEYISPWWWVWNVMLSVVALVLTLLSRRVKYISIRMERTFVQNLRQREQQGLTSYGRRLRGKDLQIARIKVPVHSKWAGKTLAQLHFGRTDRIHITSIIRAGHRINIPGGSNKIYAGDELEIVSGAEAVNRLRDRAQQEVWQEHELSADNRRLSVISITLSRISPFIGKTLVDIDFRQNYHCMVIGVENAEGHLDVVEAQRPFCQGDIVWLVGEESDLSMLEMVV